MDTPTVPYVAFIESDAGDNDNWIGDHAGDPDLINWSDFTEGTDAIVFESVISRKVQARTGNIAEARAGGLTYRKRLAKRFYVFNYNVKVLSIAAVNKVVHFSMSDRHTLASSYVDYYLVDVEAANTHREFVDEDDATLSYCQAELLATPSSWSESRPNEFTIILNGVSVF